MNPNNQNLGQQSADDIEIDSNQENDPFLNEEVTVIKHRESTLELDSPLLNAIEEINGEKEQKKQHHGLAILGICLVMIGIAVAIFYVAFGGNEEKKNEDPAAQKAEDTPAMPAKEKRDVTLIPYKATPEFTEVMINGIALRSLMFGHDEHEGIPVVDGENNMVTFSLLGYVPQQQIVTSNSRFLEVELQNDEIFQHSIVTLKLPKNASPSKAFVYINGQMRNAEKEMRIEGVSGFPFYIQLQQEGYGDHLEVIWPTKGEQTVELPNLVSAENASRSTEFTLDVPKEYQADPSFVLNVTAEGKTSSTPGKRVFKKNEMVSIKMTKDGRYPMEMLLDTTPFGSIHVMSYMQLASLGAATINFTKNTDTDITLCFRRASEAMCLDPFEENIVPSGKWELAAYWTDGEERHWFENAPYETLTNGATYSVKLSRKGKSFHYDLNKVASPKKKK